MQEPLGIKNKIENPPHTLPVQIDSVISERYQKYRIILQPIPRVFYLLDKKDLALRGYRKDISDIFSNIENPGNLYDLIAINCSLSPDISRTLKHSS